MRAAAALVQLLAARAEAARLALRLLARRRMAAEAESAALVAEHRRRMAAPATDPAETALADAAWQGLRARRRAEIERRLAALDAEETAARAEARLAFGREQAARALAARLAAQARRTAGRRARS